MGGNGYGGLSMPADQLISWRAIGGATKREHHILGEIVPAQVKLVLNDDSELDAQLVRTDVVDNDYLVAFFPRARRVVRVAWTKRTVCSPSRASIPAFSARTPPPIGSATALPLLDDNGKRKAKGAGCYVATGIPTGGSREHEAACRPCCGPRRASATWPPRERVARRSARSRCWSPSAPDGSWQPASGRPAPSS